MHKKVVNNDVYERYILTSITTTPDYQNNQKAIDIWRNSERGTWLLEHGIDIATHKSINHHNWTYNTVITGYFKAEDWTWYLLKWS